jgi:hypothetical protein
VRRLGGPALIALGVLSAVLGVGLAVLFGPDDRIGSGPHRLSTPGQAIVTAPSAIAYAGPRVELTVTSTQPQRKLFVGVAHDVDVRDFLDGTPRTRIDTIEVPWRVTTTNIPGSGFPKADPGDQTWWYADAEGRGEVTVGWRLPDTAADVVILDEDGGTRLAVDVTAEVVAPGVFVVGLALAVIGLGLAVFGWAMRPSRPARRGVHATRDRARDRRTRQGRRKR